MLAAYINKILPWLQIQLMEYQTVYHIQAIRYDSEISTLLFAVAVGVFYTLFYNLLGSILVEKRDVL